MPLCDDRGHRRQLLSGHLRQLHPLCPGGGRAGADEGDARPQRDHGGGLPAWGGGLLQKPDPGPGAAVSGQKDAVKECGKGMSPVY